MLTGSAGSSRCAPWAMPMPIARPSRPPSADSTTASPRNSAITVRRRAPSEISRPISAVRSVTAIVMMVTMPTPPTSSEMPPSAPTAIVTMFRMLESVPSMSAWVTRVKSSRPWRAISSARACATTAAGDMRSS